MFKTSRRPSPRRLRLRPPRCSPAWSHVQSQPPACHAPSSATTLLASVEPCSKPAACLPRALFGHHAACQRGAMFKASRRPATRSLRPPRCLPAWSHVQSQPSACHSPSSATTLLASVEPCSKPAACLPRALFGHHAACQRGAMFKTSRLPATRSLRPPRCLPAWSHVQNQPSAQPEPSSSHCVQRLEHRSTLASSVVAKTTDLFANISGLEHRSTLASSVVAKTTDLFANISGLEHRSTLASSVVAKQPIS